MAIEIAIGFVVSRAAFLTECYIEGNSKPFIDRTPGPPFSITIQRCYYDVLGIKEADVVTHQCINIGANDFPFSDHAQADKPTATNKPFP